MNEKILSKNLFYSRTSFKIFIINAVSRFTLRFRDETIGISELRPKIIGSYFGQITLISPR